MGSVLIHPPQPETIPFLYACVDPDLACPDRCTRSRRRKIPQACPEQSRRVRVRSVDANLGSPSPQMSHPDPALSETEGRFSKRKKQPRTTRRAKPNTKRTGELAESAFLHAAQLRQIRVAKPWGDSERYDFIVDSGCRFWRVQIKATATLIAGGYEVQATYCEGKRKGHLTPSDIDLFAAYILPHDVWYFIPAEYLPPSASLRFYPHRQGRHARFEHYRDAWHYLLPDPDNSPEDLEWFLQPNDKR